MISGLAGITGSIRRPTFGVVRVPTQSIEFADVPVEHEHERETSMTRAPTLTPTT
jgi:hypothetical protein